jgi:hypothetical protein
MDGTIRRGTDTVPEMLQGGAGPINGDHELRCMAAKKRRTKKPVTTDQLAREAKRAAQKAAGALDGRFREKVVKSGKTYARKPKHPDADI